ncbi:hypothetical protein GOV05_02830 [Candidatus Woesearchaeota archaeon]|nr:hypothetical protein [Candidatus Woesearchaeota archaeon]
MIRWGKKGDFSVHWVEYVFIFLLVMGFAISFSIDNLVIVYLVSYVAGLQCGVVTYTSMKRTMRFPVWLIIIGFLLGYLLGSFQASKFAIILLFLIGLVNGHMLFKKKIFVLDNGKNDKKNS